MYRIYIKYVEAQNEQKYDHGVQHEDIQNQEQQHDHGGP